MTRWLCLIALAGCATPLAGLTRSSAAAVGATAVELRSAPLTNEDHARLSGALARVAPKLERWGGLERRLTVFVLPDHDALERAVSRRGYSWLRAWATDDTLLLQAPRTFSPNDAELDELLLHELTHCLMFQRIGTPETWRSKRVPFWFREGLATVTAGQALRFLSLEDLADWIDAHPGVDVFAEAEALSRDAYAPMYALASHATAFLLRRLSADGVTTLFAAMRAGASFDDAFVRVAGTDRDRMQADFLTYLRFRGFRGFGRKVRPGPHR